MIHAALLTVALLAFPPGYVEAFSQARAENKPAFVLLTMDGCGPCNKAKTLAPLLRKHGTFIAVNISHERLLGRKLLGKTNGVPQLLACKWTGRKWDAERIIGLEPIQELANGMHAEQIAEQPDKQPATPSGLMNVKVPAIRPSPGTSSPLLNDLLSRNRRPTGETEAGSQAHYATHFINSEVRNEYNYSAAIYLGGGKAYLLNQPGTTLNAVGRTVPASLRGPGFQDYVIASQSLRNVPAQYRHLPVISQNASPLFLLDEWSAYLAGTQACADTGTPIDVDDVRVLEMMAYSFVMCYCAEQGDKTWLPATKHLVRILTERTLKVCEAAYNVDPAGYRARVGPYVMTLRDAPDAEGLRQYIRGVWGAEWTKNLLGF